MLEVGCGPGAAAREVSRRVAPGFVLATDRSDRAVAQARRACSAEIAAGAMSVRRVAVEDLCLEPDDEPFDLVFAVRVGALDGRHPELEVRARQAMAAVLAPDGRVFVDGEALTLDR